MTNTTPFEALLFVCVLASAKTCLWAAEPQDSLRVSDMRPITVSPIIGDTLDQEERDYFRFFLRPKPLEGFYHAVFYEAADGRATIKITRKSIEGARTDTLVSTGLTGKMIKSGLLSVLLENREGREWGREVEVILRNGGELEGELLGVDGGSIFICLEPEAPDSDLADETVPIVRSSLEEIKTLVLAGSSAIGQGSFYGFFGGMAVGGGLARLGGEPALGSAMAAVGGGGLGLLVGFTVGAILSTPARECELTQRDSLIAELASSSRWPTKIPPFIKRVTPRQEVTLGEKRSPAF